jgi:hypothetical protein
MVCCRDVVLQVKGYDASVRTCSLRLNRSTGTPVMVPSGSYAGWVGGAAPNSPDTSYWYPTGSSSSSSSVPRGQCPELRGRLPKSHACCQHVSKARQCVDSVVLPLRVLYPEHPMLSLTDAMQIHH